MSATSKSLIILISGVVIIQLFVALIDTAAAHSTPESVTDKQLQPRLTFGGEARAFQLLHFLTLLFAPLASFRQASESSAVTEAPDYFAGASVKPDKKS